MREVTCKIYKPSEKLPQSSTAMKHRPVLILYRLFNDTIWGRGIYLADLQEWRVESQNFNADVIEWMELPIAI